MSLFAALLFAVAQPAAPQLLPLHDEVRGRPVPVALYGAVEGSAKPLALISHGYGARHTDYRFLADWLVARGFVVASVQHEVAGDPPIPAQGNPQVVRRPFWQRGVDNLLVAMGALEARGLADLSRGVVLVGHSNGGDTSMLFAAQHPRAVRAVYSLDSRRMPFPRVARPRICSARSSDQQADAGVLPAIAEQGRRRMVIAPVPVTHNDMNDAATPAQRDAMLAVLERCLSRR